jgi:hypothetical protein
VEKIDDVGEERDVDTVEGPRRLVRMDDLCIAVVLQGCERRVEFGEPTSGRRTASPLRRKSCTALHAVLAAVPDRAAVGTSDAIPMCSAPNAEAHLWTSLVEPWQPRPRAVCKPELAAHHAELCCCTSQRAPRPAFNPRAYQRCCRLVRPEGGKSGAVRGGGMPNCALRRIIHPPLVVSSSVWLHELAASRLTALRERPCTGRGLELLASSFTVRKGI